MVDLCPMVSVIIATRDRPQELQRTLCELARLDYPAIELIVIDDGSTDPVRPVVDAIWPNARVIRHEESAGQCKRRNEGFALAEGKYILHLDDDCCFLGPDDLVTAVAVLEKTPNAAVLAPYIYNGEELPERLSNQGLKHGYIASFVGAAALMRVSAVRATSGYRPFFGNEWEEEELCLQLLHRGWGVWFEPNIIAHHRLSGVNRNTARTWMRGLRNRIWALLIHLPTRRLMLEVGWKLMIGCWDSIRLARPLLFIKAIGEAVARSDEALRLRDPMDVLALRRYDSLRLRRCLTDAEFAHPPELGLRDLSTWWIHWRGRARDSACWSHHQSGTGGSYNVGYAHERDERQ